MGIYSSQLRVAPLERHDDCLPPGPREIVAKNEKFVFACLHLVRETLTDAEPLVTRG